MGKYSQFGLDDNKKAVDDSEQQGGHCLWCDTLDRKNSQGKGLSMCFSNFMICTDCLDAAATAKGTDKWIVEECFRCKQVLPGYRTVEGSVPYVICETCSEFGRTILSMPPPPPPPGTQLPLL